MGAERAEEAGSNVSLVKAGAWSHTSGEKALLLWRERGLTGDPAA